MTEATEARLVRCPRCGNLLTELPDFSLYKCGGCGVVLEAGKKGIRNNGLPGAVNDVNCTGISAECGLRNMPEISVGSVCQIERTRMENRNNQRVTFKDSSIYRSENAQFLADFDVIRRGKERIRRAEYYDDDHSYYQGMVRKHGEYRNVDVNIPEYVNFQGEQRRFDNFSYHDEGSSSYEMSYEHGDKVRYRERDLSARVENLEHNRVELLNKLDELKDQLTRSRIINDQPKERLISTTLNDPFDRHRDAYAQEGLTSSYGVNRKPMVTDELESSYLSHMNGYIPSPARFVSGPRDSYFPRDFSHEYKGRTYHQHQEDFFGYPESINHDPFTLHTRDNFLHEPSCSCVRCSNRDLDVPSKIHHPLHGVYNRNIHHHLSPKQHVSQDYNPGDINLHSRQSHTPNSKDQDFINDGSNTYHHRSSNATRRRGRSYHPLSGGAPFITCCNCFELLKLPRKHVSLTKKLQIKCGSCFSVILFELRGEGNVTSVSAHVDQISTDINQGSNNMDSNISHIKGEEPLVYPFPPDDKSKYDESEKQLDPVSSVSTISVNERNADIDKKSNLDELEKHLDPFSATSNITMVKHDSNSNSNSNKSEEQLGSLSASSSITVDGHNIDAKLDSRNLEKLEDPVSVASIVSMDKCNINTNKMPEYDESKIQFDPISSPLNISLNSHTTQVKEESNCDGPKSQLDPLSAPLDSSSDELSTGTDEESNYDELGNLPNPLCPNSDMSVDQNHMDNATYGKTSNFSQEFPGQYIGSNSGNLSNKRSEQTETTFAPSSSWQNPPNAPKMTTVTNMPVNKFSTGSGSQEFTEMRKENHPIANIGSKPFAAAVAKNFIRDFSSHSRSLEIEESKVFVNGHFIPASEVENAEKLAGPIQPGDYWYDYQAGFWGVMGHPCLGIVMPHIEEFNYPLPEDCAAGNTGVTVNGRELHQKDLDILASRGLPALTHGSYTVNISGKVIDEHTGKALVELGKLAPTVEKQNCGFGMRVP